MQYRSKRSDQITLEWGDSRKSQLTDPIFEEGKIACERDTKSGRVFHSFAERMKSED